MLKLISLIFIILFLLAPSHAFSGEGHDAGYEWAVEHNITDVDYANGNSESFNEGVRQYAEEQAEEAEEEYEYEDGSYEY